MLKGFFELAAERKGPKEIAGILTNDKILVPSAYTRVYHPEQCNFKSDPTNCKWSSTTISQILDRREYLGHTILRKSVCTNFKTDSRRATDESEQYVFENTHEAIIDQELWDTVQKVRERCVRMVPIGTYANANPYQGMIFCADCGSRMSYDAHYLKNGNMYFNFRCTNYGKEEGKCSMHYISENALGQILLHSIQRVSKYVIENEEEFARELQQKWMQKNEERPKREKEELNFSNKRLSELDNLICKLYEDFAAGHLPERQYQLMVQKYSDEQNHLEEIIQNLESY